MARHFLDYYRCPQIYAEFLTTDALSGEPHHFRWGKDILCYARTTAGFSVGHKDPMPEIEETVDFDGTLAILPFDPEEVTENLQRERYSAHFREAGRIKNAMLRKIYYLIRPLLGVSIRKHIQRAHLRGWNKISFPEWPVDCTVERLHRKRMLLAMKARNVDKVPFIWFWPDKFTSCAVITHDVEEAEGRDFCSQLMDLDEAHGFRSSFQVVPEVRYSVSREYLKSITDRGFEVNVHDLKHDGRLYAERAEFHKCAQKINEYARQYGALGFRSGILYRNADWYDAFDLLYDMSIPNVGHLDPQRGGCCTVLPYFIGKMVELPLTCTQDYTIFHILKDYSIELWKKQIDMIRNHYGLVNILVHPDYVMERRAQLIYRTLLEYLAKLRDSDPMWAPLPRDVATWWKQRSQMRLVCNDGQWRIEGEGRERASIAYATIEGDKLTYSLAGETMLAKSEPY